MKGKLTLAIIVALLHAHASFAHERNVTNGMDVLFGGEPGVYQTSHIFTKPGEGEVTLTCKISENETAQTLKFPVVIYSRQQYEIP